VTQERLLLLEDAADPGIPASELGAVMQRFYRVDRARTPGGGSIIALKCYPQI
jgi:signal transduction histidine kinase